MILELITIMHCLEGEHYILGLAMVIVIELILATCIYSSSLFEIVTTLNQLIIGEIKFLFYLTKFHILFF